MNYCTYDYDHPVPKGRAHWMCPKCGQDNITIALAMRCKERDDIVNEKKLVHEPETNLPAMLLNLLVGGAVLALVIFIIKGIL